MTARPAGARSPSLRGTLLALSIGALAYIAVVGLDVALRIGPDASRLSRQSSGVLEEFQESRRRVDVLDDAMTDLWRLLGVARRDTVPRDTLETIRLRVQDMEESPRTLTRLFGEPGSPPELMRALADAVNRERELAETMFSAIGALELHEVANAERILRRADSLDAPLTDAMADATTIALRAVNEHEQDLAATASNTARMVWLWLVAGAIAVALLAVFLHRRLYAPLAAFDAGLARIAAGDLSVNLTARHADELGRLSAHFNRMTDVLRQRALAEDQRMADERAARTRLILDSALDAVVVMDARGVIREWNPQAEVVLGWKRDEVLGASIGNYMLPSEFRAVYADGRLKVGDPVALKFLNQRVETVAVRRDGLPFPVEVAVTQLTRGTEIEFCAFVRDISERRAAQLALSASEERYRAAFEQAAVGMVEVGLSGHFIRVNGAFSRIVGYSPEELEGQSFRAITHPEDIDGDETAFDDLLSGRVPAVHREKRYNRKDGSIATVRIDSALVRDNHGEPAYALTVMEDISERKRLEDELRQVQKMEAVGRLAGGIAHDFNNLLAGIMGYADLLQYADGTDAQAREDARAIIATAKQGADLAQNLLMLARRNPQRAERVSVHDIVAEVTKLVTRTFDRSIDIETDLAFDPLIVRGDRSQLTNALLNLAINAKDAMPDGGRLMFEARQVHLDATFAARFADSVAPGEYVAISVRDTGLGMSPETRARVFEPFFTTKGPGKGTGLGLAMVYGTARSHDGLVEVDSTLGRGSTFTLYLPRRDDLVVDDRVESPGLVPGGGKILVAEDEATVRDVVSRMLERLGYAVDRVSDGAKAVEAVRENPGAYVLVILDGDMPLMTGREAAPKIAALVPDLPLILASGNLDGDTAREMPELGFVAAISKPYTLAEISRLVSTHARRPALN